MILPIVMIAVCLLMGGGVYVYVKLSEKKKASGHKAISDPAITTANEFINVKDINGKFLYTRDNLVMCYLKILPISIDLFSKNEKKQMIRQLTAAMSSIQYPFQLIAVSCPVDISPLLSDLSATLTASSDMKQKELLRQEILEMSTFALSGEVVERQFYILLWDKTVDGVEGDLLQKIKYLSGYFNESGIFTEILEQQEIVRLCNLINNPAYVHLEDTDFEASIPVLESAGDMV